MLRIIINREKKEQQPDMNFSLNLVKIYFQEEMSENYKKQFCIIRDCQRKSFLSDRCERKVYEDTSNIRKYTNDN